MCYTPFVSPSLDVDLRAHYAISVTAHERKTESSSFADRGAFTASQRDTLAHLARCILRGAPESGDTVPDGLISRCESRLIRLPAHRQARLALGLDVLGSRSAVLVAIGRPARFAQLNDNAQLRCLNAWSASRVAPLRSAYQAIRKLVLAVYYAAPNVAAAIGYAGPLHQRAMQVPWEGPLPGIASDADPIARGARVLPISILHDVRPAGVFPGSTCTRDVHLRTDCVVIGTGAGGAVTASRMAEAGYQVVMLEAGPYMTRADFTEDEASLNESLYAEGGLRTTDDLSFALLQGESVGGSSTVNWMIMLRTPDHVLEEWARDHGVYGMRPRDMAPVFDRIEREVHARDVPDDAHSANNRIVLDGAAALGWRASTARINAVDCVRCGYCGIGCRHNAKQSTLLTYVPRALTAGATLYANARVTHIEQHERDVGVGTPPIKRVHALVSSGLGDRAPRVLMIDAPLVVIAGGAIETPALLQRSGMGGGGVGNWLRLHPTTAVSGVYTRDIVASSGIPLSTMCDEFSRWNGSDYGFWIECPPLLPSFTAAAVSGAGPEHASRMRQFRQTGVLIALTRDGADTQVSSGRVRVDGAGRTSIRYQLSNEDQRRVRASIDAAARLHFAAGATEVVTMHAPPLVMRDSRDLASVASASLAPNRVAMYSAHVNGTCRMGGNPKTSGTTPEGERHGVRGLYISDGSLLPTSLGVNPQETIMAVATVLAERMATRHAGMTRT